MPATGGEMTHRMVYGVSALLLAAAFASACGDLRTLKATSVETPAIAQPTATASEPAPSETVTPDASPTTSAGTPTPPADDPTPNATPIPTAGELPPETPAPTPPLPTPTEVIGGVGPDGVPRVPPLPYLTFSPGPDLGPEDLARRGISLAGAGSFSVARVVISLIGVDAPTDVQLVVAEERRPPPASSDVVTWYDWSHIDRERGGVPLASGNTVFGGAYTRPGGGAGVFRRLEDLGLGELITLVLDDGRSLYYRVEFNKTAPASLEFWAIATATGNESTTLITDAGTLLPNGTYSRQRIVFARRENCSVNEHGGVGCEVPQPQN